LFSRSSSVPPHPRSLHPPVEQHQLPGIRTRQRTPAGFSSFLLKELSRKKKEKRGEKKITSVKEEERKARKEK
jgi:hypothetical protein